MNVAAQMKTHTAAITRPDKAAPILIIDRTEEGTALALRAGTIITIDGADFNFADRAVVTLPDLIPGEDYGVRLDAEGKPFASLLGPENPVEAGWLGGFHYALGGNATGRDGGDSTPAINPYSLWDLGFRPACPDPRGMTCVELGAGNRAWIDIFLLCVDHGRHGTSRCGVTIADGRSLPRLNYHDAAAVMAKYGKRLAAYDEFRAAAYGVKERSSADSHPKITGLDAARTSACGLMQATGNLWIWGTDGDLDDPAPSIFGGGWIYGGNAGSRYASLDYWPEVSNENISARGACDHLGA